jgi:hypothetical protein
MVTTYYIYKSTGFHLYTVVYALYSEEKIWILGRVLTGLEPRA